MKLTLLVTAYAVLFLYTIPEQPITRYQPACRVSVSKLDADKCRPECACEVRG